MAQPCPVTLKYLAVVRSLYDFNSMILEQYLPQLEQLEELARVAGNSRKRQHQRAFLCVELMRYRLPMHLATSDGGWAALTEAEWPRSREGLNTLLSRIDTDMTNLVGYDVEYTLVPPKDSVQLLRANDQKAFKVFNLLHESAVMLRQSLGNEDISLSRIAKRLALAAQVVQLHVPDVLNMGQDLLEQTENFARRAWELPRK
jgi:hypothetical protein